MRRGRPPQAAIRAGCVAAVAILLIGACAGDDATLQGTSTAVAAPTTTSLGTNIGTSPATTTIARVIANTTGGPTSARPGDGFECPADHPGEWVLENGAGDAAGDGSRYLVLNRRQYMIDFSQSSIPATAIGDQVAQVCFNLTDMRFEPGTFQTSDLADLPDGDAWRIAAATPIYTIVGGDPLLRLAIDTVDGWRTIEVLDIAGASSAAQLIDLVGPFSAIVVSRWEGDVELARLDDPSEVALLIEALRASPLLEAPFPAGEPALSIDLVRPDGTTTRRFVDQQGERLSPRIELPTSWVTVLQAAANAG